MNDIWNLTLKDLMFSLELHKWWTTRMQKENPQHHDKTLASFNNMTTQ